MHSSLSRILLVSLISLFLSALFYHPCHATATPVCAIKGGTDGYIYIPNIPNLQVKTLKIQLWCNDPNPSRMQGDQKGGTSPYSNIPEYPDGNVALLDYNFIAGKYGTTEGGTNWNYMADCVPDRTVDLKDTNTVSRNYGQSGGSYTSDLTGIKVVFSDGTVGYPDANGFVSIPSGATYFHVYKDTTSVMTLVYFFTESLVKTWHNVTTWNLQVLARRWSSVASWMFNLQSMMWHNVATWVFQLLPKQWNDVATWTIRLLARRWSSVASWMFNLPSMAWHNIANWVFNMATLGWHDITLWQISIGGTSIAPLFIGMLFFSFIVILIFLYAKEKL
jgi:hypothetical protein